MSKKLLLVEDEALIAMTEAQMLKDHGYEVLTAYNAQKAIETVEESNIDLILMDIDLGDGKMDGTEAAKIILQNHDIPVVFLSSHTEPEIVEKTEKITSYGYIVKDSGETVLLTSLKMAFQLFDAKMEQKQKEDELRRSDSKYRMLFENMNIPFGLHEVIYDDKGNPVDYRYLDMNPMFLNNLGCTASEIRGHTAKELFPNTEQYWIDTFGEVAKTGQSVSFLNYSQELNQWFNTFVFSPQKDQFGAFFIDITERKKVEEELKKNEKSYRLLTETTSDIVFEVDLNGYVTYCTPSAWKILGFTQDEIIGSHFIHFFPESWILFAKENFKQVIENRTAMNVEVVINHKSGKEIPVDVLLEPIIENGKVMSIRGNVRDVSDKKQVEEKLRENEYRLRMSQHIAKLGHFTWDVKTGEVIWSAGLYDLLGYDKSEKIDYAKVNKEIHHPDDLERVTRWLHDCIESGDEKLSPNEYRLFRKDKKVIYVNTVGIIERSGDNHIKVFATIQDITERKHTEEGQRGSELQYRTLYNEGLNSILLVDEYGKYIDANKAALEFLECDRDELLKKNVWDFSPPDKIERQKQEHAPFTQPRTIETDYYVKGRIKTLLLNVVPTKIKEKIVLYGIGQDITERKQLEAKRIESENRYRALVDNSPFGIVEIEQDGTIVSINKNVADTLGTSVENLIGKNMSIFTSGAVLEKRKDSCLKAIKTKKIVELEDEKDGNIFHHIIAPICDRDKPTVQIISNDITEKRATENIVKESEKKYRLLFNYSNDAIFVHEIGEDNLPGRIIEVNEQACRLLQYSRDELLQKSIKDITLENNRSLMPSRAQELMEKKHLTFEAENIRRDGVVITVEVSAYCYNEGGKQFVLSSVRDITNRKKSEEQKDFLMKELNHRVKNNLAMVSSLVSLKNSSLGDEIDLSDLNHQINVIRLIHEKLYQGKDVSHVNLKEYIHELNTNVFFLSKRHVEIEEHIDDISLSTKTAIPLGLIINEIATNAVKYGFTAEGDGRFSVDLTEDKNNKQYILIISNNGKPFPKDVTLDNPDTLGLQLVSALVSQLNGTIELQREPHPVFTIRFPAEELQPRL